MRTASLWCSVVPGGEVIFCGRANMSATSRGGQAASETNLPESRSAEETHFEATEAPQPHLTSCRGEELDEQLLAMLVVGQLSGKEEARVHCGHSRSASEQANAAEQLTLFPRVDGYVLQQTLLLHSRVSFPQEGILLHDGQPVWVRLPLFCGLRDDGISSVASPVASGGRTSRNG